MSCNRPLPAYRDRGGHEVRIGYDFGTGDAFEVPCGKCVGCRMDRAKAWTVRIEHEAQMWERNRFVTLTYRDDALPADLSLRYRDVQLFMKRLRKRAGPGNGPVRFFLCGEYGGRTGRPHYHAILFNFAPPDERFLANGTARSEWIEDVWSHGHAVLGSVTSSSAAYVAGYTLKKAGRAPIVVDHATGEYFEREPEFVQMSRRPGIGARWFERFGADVFPQDQAVMSGGKVKRPPRYYFEKFKATDPAKAEDVRERRFQRARLAFLQGESSPERRAVREELALARSEFFSPREL